MKITTIIGARPQFIKAASISRAIIEYNQSIQFRQSAQTQDHRSINISEVIVHTGQHYDDQMSAIFFKELEIPEPDYNLGVGSGSHGWQTSQMLEKIEEILIREQPDWVLVYGDTNSTLAGALAAAKLHIKVAHVEAGLRSFNRMMPEEVNRIIADHISDLLLCPSQTAVNNLTNEGINQGVHIVGDVMADSLAYASERVELHSRVLDRFELLSGKYLLATIHRAENTDNPERLKSILSAFRNMEETIVLPIHPRTRNVMTSLKIHEPANVRIIKPVGYLDMIALEKSARVILTDSGGIQKEAYWLGIPCVTLREETEWLETVKSGWNQLVGAEEEEIIRAVRSITKPETHPELYGNGRAAESTVGLLTEAFHPRA
ncbi:MAG: non-hydrolyzing UDP-N-acetylglucosamine 2-epimerase [Syntrophales bacterium]